MKTTLNVLFAAVLLAFAGTASAVTYDIENGNILAIGNLELNFDNDELDGFYNITFVTDTGVSQYGPADNPTFDFELSENGVTAMPQITDAINAAPEAVTGASATGSDVFFIPLIRVPIPLIGTVWGALGAENIAGTWGDCKNDCLVGVRPLGPDDVNTFARVALVPVPAAVWLFGSALGLLGWVRRKTSA